MHRSLERLSQVGLYIPTQRRINRAIASEFFQHAARFLLATKLGPSARGIPTAWGVDPLAARIQSTEPPPVWPSAEGTVRGPSVEPLVPSIELIAVNAPELYSEIALVDAIRIGNARERSIATDLLLERLTGEEYDKLLL
jgi:hypothetical protein